MKAALIALTLAFAASAPAFAQDASALAKSKNCLSCHSVDKKVVGPAYKDVAKKFNGQKEAEAQLIKAVMEGSKGVWGPIPMPANKNVSQAEAKQLVDWILSLK